MAKIVFIGDLLTLQPFLALGQDVRQAANTDEARQIVARLDPDAYALVVFTPGTAAARDALRGPASLVLPGFGERETDQARLVAEAVRKATGRAE